MSDSAPKSSKPLRPRHRAFADAYLETWNETEAARRVKLAHPDRQGSRLLKNVEVQAYIQKRLQEKAMSADEVLARLAEQARGSLDDFITLNGRGFRIDVAKARKAGKMHLIKSISKGKQGTRIEICDAQAALVHIGRHLKLFTDMTEISGEITVKVIKGVSMDEL